MAKVIANQAFRVALEDGSRFVKEGQVFEDDDVIVVGREDLFDTLEGAVQKTQPKTRKAKSSSE